jgi:peptide/nickel transport system substrate-binding protein
MIISTMGKGRTPVLSLIAISVLLLVASGIGRAQTPEYGGILRIIDMAEGANPIGVPWENFTIDTKLMTPVIETLYDEDFSGKIHPHLATSYKVDLKNKTLTFTLGKGVKFHDGTDFDAEAVRWCWQQAIDAKVAPGWDSVEAVDQYTVRVHFKTFQNDFLNRAGTRAFGIISPSAFKKNGIEWARWNPVGTGPFKFVKFQRGAVLQYRKYDGYWMKGRPYLDGIDFLFIRDPLTQQAAVRSKDPDQKVSVLAVTSAEQAFMMQNQGFKVVSTPIGPISLIPDSVNADSPLSKQKVREAISYAINREGIVKARGFGIWKPAYQIQPDNMATYIPNLQGTQYNPQKARQLLAEAGYPSGFKTKIIVMPAMVDRDAMVAVQRNLSDVGIQAEMEFPDNGGYTNYRFGGWKNALLAHHTRAVPNFNQTFQMYFHPDWKQFPSLKRTEGLVDAIDASSKAPEINREKGQVLTKLVFQDTMVIPVYYVYELYALTSDVHDTGYGEWGASTVFIPENAWLSKK